MAIWNLGYGRGLPTQKRERPPVGGLPVKIRRVHRMGGALHIFLFAVITDPAAEVWLSRLMRSLASDQSEWVQRRLKILVKEISICLTN
jgi:hypothetical protein